MKDEPKDKLLAALAWFVVLMAIVAMCLPLGGCSTPKEVVYINTHDTIYQNKVIHDSVDRWHTHYEYIKGDTLHSIDTFYQDRWHLRTDTLYKTDVITETKTEVKEVEKKVYVWWPCFVILGAPVALFLWWWIKRKLTA